MISVVKGSKGQARKRLSSNMTSLPMQDDGEDDDDPQSPMPTSVPNFLVKTYEIVNVS